MICRCCHMITLVFLMLGTIVAGARGPVTKLLTGVQSQPCTLLFNGQDFIFQGQIGTLLLDEREGEERYTDLEIPGFYTWGEEGSPALPRISTMLISGPGQESRFRIEVLDSVIYDLRELGLEAPLAPHLASPRKGDPRPEARMDSANYKTDHWIGGPLFRLEFEGIMRGSPLSTLHFNPVRYNPVEHKIKVYHRVKCSISSTAQEELIPNRSWAFRRFLSRLAGPEASVNRKALFVEEPMTLVILSDTLFRNALQSFISWKERKGFRVVEAYLQDPSVGGSAGSIKSHLSSLYTDPPPGIAPPSYLLIVGDVEQVPLSKPSGNVTDLYYTTFDGEEDYLPDLFYGRISVTHPDQLLAVTHKIMEYERFQFQDPSFLDESVLIAGVDGTFAATHGNGQINYAHTLYLNGSNGSNAHLFPYPESDTGEQQILDLISGGVGFVNYTGHGLHDGWLDPAFKQEDIPALENRGKYPLMIGNGCETNIFTLGECFAEALLRAPEKGALAYIGCTSDSYWDEDYFWAVGVGPIVAEPAYEGRSEGYYDKVFHTHGEPYAIWTPSLGEMVFGGNMAVQQSSSSRKKFYWEIYQLAGDPTIVPWFTRPGERTVTYPPVLPAGSSRLDVSCSPFDYVALSRDGLLLDAIHASVEGYATLDIPDTLNADTLELIISGDRFVPAGGTVILGTPGAPYLELLEYSLSAESVAEDGAPSPGEEWSLNLSLVNRGAETLPQDTLVLFTEDEQLLLLDSMVVLDGAGAGDTVSLTGVFRIAAGAYLTDQEQVRFGLLRRGDPQGVRFFMHAVTVAPRLVSRGITWDDRSSGNGNGIAEPGEWLTLYWDVENKGHFPTGSLRIGVLHEGHPLMDRLQPWTGVILGPGDSSVLGCEALLSETLQGATISGSLIADDGRIMISDRITLHPGRHFEDFSGNPLERYAFSNSLEAPWIMDPETCTSPPFSLRSGRIADHGVSVLKLRLDCLERDTVSFSARISSEEDYDFLRIYLDGVQVGSWSGETEWQNYSVELEAGTHELAWAYEKDQSLSRGEDAAWIDDLVFPETAFRRHDLSLIQVLEPLSGPWLTDQERIRLLIRNTGSDPVPGFTVGVDLDHLPFQSDTSTGTILPGGETILEISRTMDLSAFESHTLSARVWAEEELFRGNNQLSVQVEKVVFPDLSLSLEDLVIQEGVRSEVVLGMENRGNIPLDSVRIAVWLNDSLVDSRERFPGLEPGGFRRDTLLLADAGDPGLFSGSNEFLIRALGGDSVDFNDVISGSFYWLNAALERYGTGNGILLYPNPAREWIHIRLDRPAEGFMEVRLVDNLGRIVVISTLEEGARRFQITLPDLPRGHYLLRMEGTEIALPVVVQ